MECEFPLARERRGGFYQLWPRLALIGLVTHPGTAPPPKRGTTNGHGVVLRRDQERQTFNSLPFPSIPIPRTLIFAFSQREGTLTPLHPSREPLRLGRPSEVRRSGKLLIQFRLVPFRSVSCRLRGAWDARFLPSRERRGVFAYTTHVTNVRAGAAMAQ